LSTTSDSATLTRLIDGTVNEQSQQILIYRPIGYKDTIAPHRAAALQSFINRVAIELSSHCINKDDGTILFVLVYSRTAPFCNWKTYKRSLKKIKKYKIAIVTTAQTNRCLLILILFYCLKLHYVSPASD